MRTVFIICVVLGLLLGHVHGSCHIVPSGDQKTCVTSDGTSLMVGEEIKVADQCEECSCHARVGQTAVLHCCGYGVNAGLILPPEGCRVLPGDDGCSVTLVRIKDGSPC